MNQIESIDFREERLKRRGVLYHDTKNNEALTFKNTKTNKKLTWCKPENYSEFVDRCLNFNN